MCADPNRAKAILVDLAIEKIKPNKHNPRLDFPQDELDKLADSIDQEGILVPVVVFPEDDHYVLVDGERRFRCALDLGHLTIPALVTERKSEREILLQMFNIHLIREPWRDIPTALALQQLAVDIKRSSGQEPTDAELRDLTGLSLEQIRRLRYVVTLPEEWQAYIREGRIPLNFFWELKRNVIDALAARRSEIISQYGEQRIMSAFVEKRLQGYLPDIVSLRNFPPIVKFAAQDAKQNGTGFSQIDSSIRDLIEDPNLTIDQVYENTVQMMVEMDKLSQQTKSMVAAFRRLMTQSSTDEEQQEVLELAQDLIRSLLEVIGLELPDLDQK